MVLVPFYQWKKTYFSFHREKKAAVQQAQRQSTMNAINAWKTAVVVSVAIRQSLGSQFLSNRPCHPTRRIWKPIARQDPLLRCEGSWYVVDPEEEPITQHNTTTYRILVRGAGASLWHPLLANGRKYNFRGKSNGFNPRESYPPLKQLMTVPVIRLFESTFCVTKPSVAWNTRIQKQQQHPFIY